jgi:hypothetical protein
VCLTLGSAVPSTAGTNFAIGTASGWGGFGASEKQRVTATTSIAATFTNTAGASDHFITGAFVFTESTQTIQPSAGADAIAGIAPGVVGATATVLTPLTA